MKLRELFSFFLAPGKQPVSQLPQGAVRAFALRNYIGKDRVNDALRRLLGACTPGPPLPTPPGRRAGQTVTVPRKPARAGIDPNHRLIDPEMHGNTVQVGIGND